MNYGKLGSWRSSMQLQADINDDAAPNLCFEDASSNTRHLG